MVVKHKNIKSLWCHMSASSLSMVVADAVFFGNLRHFFLSSHVLYFSTFIYVGDDERRGLP